MTQAGRNVASLGRPLVLAAVAALILTAAAIPGRADFREPQQDQHCKDLSYPLVPESPDKLDKPAAAEIYQYDLDPLANRIPLMMLHGGGGESRPLFRLDRIAQWLNQDQEFQKKYKIYFLRYNASSVLDESVPHIEEALREFGRRVRRPFCAIGYSLGGNALQRALLNPDVDSVVDLVIALGTPFRGSPLFCSDWYEYSLHRNHHYPWSRLLKTHSRRLYFNRHPHFLSDLRWDNADGHVPEVGNFRSLVPFGPRGNLTIEGTSNERLAAINNEGELTKHKFITYAGYLPSPLMMPTPIRQLILFVRTPIDLLGTKFPLIFGDEHAALRILNHDISRVLVHPGGLSGSAKTMPYLLNDGLAPVTSCILFAPEAFRAYPAPRASDLPRLGPWLDVRLARVFRNIDHVSFADGRPPHLGSFRVKDEMHPDEHPRPLLDWLLLDLLDFANRQGPDQRIHSTTIR